ncbi:uncharacterized protein CTRU02_200648 [Colletotrichum truncatum]|uniref:Uncharacterized protein n=1 Tax=Colletotrichum truncatum TaxID=5467 RepID=A0ACC3ZF65_COLTU|nr:uncharacterized protein CTRU02_00411 [Colletotrichum truncatum]KAF6801662.1 hypothetical protein CTRU02_00411 [Colletotrichum truncatum]
MFSKLVVALIAATTAIAAPLEAPLEARQAPSTYFTPSATFNYNTRDGAIYPSGWGQISKYTGNNGNDITTLLTFTYPEGVSGKKCQFFFYADGSTYASGSKKIDVFTSNKPAPAGGSPGWGAGGPGNQRNNNVGRLSVPAGGYATWDATYGAYLTSPTDCKAPGTVEGIELVGVYDNDYVSFNPTSARIAYN